MAAHTDFGDDKDRVLIKSDGELAYFAADPPTTSTSARRGFDRCIYLLGADHHGYVGRMRAMRGLRRRRPRRNLEILIGQMVKSCSATASRCG